MQKKKLAKGGQYYDLQMRQMIGTFILKRKIIQKRFHI
jgi:hypothetical protein